MASDGLSPHLPSLHLGLANHRDAITPSPCWAPHFMNQAWERLTLSNPTPSETRLSLTQSTMSDDMMSALTPPLHCASILQPATPPQVVGFESWTISAPICRNHFTLVDRNPILEPVCVFAFSSSTFAFLLDWCCFDYFVRNSLIASLETLCAQM